MKYEPGKTYSQIFYASPFRIQNITEAEVKWMHKKGALCVLFCDNDIYVKEVVVKFLTKRSDWYVGDKNKSTKYSDLIFQSSKYFSVSYKGREKDYYWSLHEIC